MAMKWETHPSVLIDGNSPRLKVFRHLKADKTLPKHLVNGKVVKGNGSMMSLDEYMNSADGMSSYRRSNDEHAGVPEKWHDRLLRWFYKKTEKKEIPPITFEEAKALLGERTISPDIENAAVRLKELVAKTRANGQVALSKRLETEYGNVLNEIVLVKNSLFHYLTEDDAVKLLQKADYGIRIDFWNDYPDFVPDDVMEAKRKADALCVFDNWCVMHYDPEGKALKQMEVEEYRRDPILFGMIVGSDRLYYVKDWKTDKDDLTIDKVCRTLGIEKIRDAKDYGGNGNGIDEIVTSINLMDSSMLDDSSYPRNPSDLLEIPPRDDAPDAREARDV